jgi:polar amino acid transport system substrate-binding protein
MKTILAILFVFSFAQARDFKEIKSAGTIRIATEGAFAPFNFFKGKELTGFEVDVANAVAKELGLKVEWKTYGFDSLLIGLNQNKYDVVIASHGITEERAKAVDFTSPHYCTGGIVVSKEGGPKTAKDLSGKVVAAQVGTTYLTSLQKVSGVKEIKTYPKDTDSFQNLMAGRVDALVTDRFIAKEAIGVHAKKAKLVTGDLLFSEQVAMAVAKNNKDLVSQLNDGLKKILANGTYKAISEKYYAEDIRCK